MRGLVAVFVLALAGSLLAAPPDLLSDLRSSDDARRLSAVMTLQQASPEELASSSRTLIRRVEKLLVKDDVAEIRGRAADVLARAQGVRAVPLLLTAVTTEQDGRAAADLARAFARIPGDEARRGLSDLAFKSRDARVAALAAEALGYLPDDAGRGDLLALLVGAPHWAVAAGACLGLARHRSKDVVDKLVTHLRHPDAAVRAAAHDALIRVCGVEKGVDPVQWERWWEASRADFQFRDREDDPLPSGPKKQGGITTDKWAPGDRPTFARFFGIPVRGKRVCFVIDFSQSMWGPRRNKAQAELIDAVKGLSSVTSFGVILFNEKVWWFGAGPTLARPQQKLDLVRYLPEQETKSYTNIYDSLERALGLLGVGRQAVEPAPGLDEIVLLSDGVPNRGKLKATERILEAIAALNGGRVRIHTVSLGDEEHELLKALAAQNGGKHVEHPFAK